MPFLPTALSSGRSSMVMKRTLTHGEASEMQGAKPPPQTLTMHFTGGTDYPPNVFLTAPAAISKTK